MVYQILNSKLFLCRLYGNQQNLVFNPLENKINQQKHASISNQNPQNIPSFKHFSLATEISIMIQNEKPKTSGNQRPTKTNKTQ